MLEFDWDDAKNASNLEKHGINFEDAIAIWEGPVLVNPSPRDGVEIAVVYTERGTAKRLISARRARTNERRAYHQAQSH
ncbi:conserved protein of unknown function [Magnetospirillum sp. XM-1]|uniref:BrnT family toxin n=1 Tax=Magnetospirillum sp. XM-1 TaxID=1663591 RepID=UPI00073DBD5B|nr:BrnT family toxin [Magnetospirillum sp. XM-1]CUW38684.1 conserved protein of unknown function [Magnetospirillum sp. XM-1]